MDLILTVRVPLREGYPSKPGHRPAREAIHNGIADGLRWLDAVDGTPRIEEEVLQPLPLSIETPFNGLTPAEAERLAWIMEECAEVQQVIGKILRHGYESTDRGRLRYDNRKMLEQELGHVQAAMSLMAEADDIAVAGVNEAGVLKTRTVQPYLHHQPAELLAAFGANGV